MTADNSRVILPEPPEDLKRLSGRLSTKLRERIRARGPLPFSEYMEAALYEPGLGYYSAGLQKFGAGGDFVTAPELGDLFAGCLSRQVEEVCEALGSFSILEVGAGSGRLAATLLQRLARIIPAETLNYRILERSGHLRQVQKETLEQQAPGLMDRVQWLDHPPRHGWRGVIIANEVLDALPVECFEKAGEEILQLNVVADGPGFDWLPGPARTLLAEAIESRLGDSIDELPEGYRSEINLAVGPWLAGLTEHLERGCALLIDYGYPRRDYYLPQRSQGTLICHYRHHAVDAPFRWPGLQDITAFVDFTAVAEAGAACGLECSGYSSQAMFLLGCGLDDEIAAQLEATPDDQLRIGAEARQLILPSEMGEKFQVMALTRGIDTPLRGFTALDLRHRL